MKTLVLVSSMMLAKTLVEISDGVGVSGGIDVVSVDVVFVGGGEGVLGAAVAVGRGNDGENINGDVSEWCW